MKKIRYRNSKLLHYQYVNQVIFQLLETKDFIFVVVEFVLSVVQLDRNYISIFFWSQGCKRDV